MNNAWRRYEDAAACKCKSLNHLPATSQAMSVKHLPTLLPPHPQPGL
jgi:hypothetical protein